MESVVSKGEISICFVMLESLCYSHYMLYVVYQICLIKQYQSDYIY